MYDVGTLFFSSAISRVSILVIFLVLLLTQKKITYIFDWVIALITSSLGSLLNMYHTNAFMLSAHEALIVYPLFFCSLSASWSGLRKFYGRKVPMALFCAVTFLPAAFYCLGNAYGFSDRVNLSFIYLMAAFVVSMVLYEIYNTSDRNIISQYVVALAFSFYLLALLLPAALIFMRVIPAYQNSSSVYAMLFDQCASILVYFGYIAMAGEQANLSLKKLAETDLLTDLTNRRGAIKILSQRNYNNPNIVRFCILIADVDHFKKINDTYGHYAGDSVLSGVAKILKINIRKLDKAVRWGGEEFLVILPKTDINEAKLLAERLRLKIQENNFSYDNICMNVTISIGVAEVRPSDSSYDQTISRADIELYNAKKSGRNRVSFNT